MQAITVVAMQAGSARLDEVVEPPRSDGALLVQVLAVGVCGTDLEVHVLDLQATGPKPALVAALGASYHTGTVADAGPRADVVVECSGADRLALDAVDKAGPDGIVCLTGVSAVGRTLTIDAGALDRELVLDNGVVFGSVNANRRHYQAAAAALAKADQGWLEGLVTRRVPLDRWAEALQRRPDDVKAVIDPCRLDGQPWPWPASLDRSLRASSPWPVKLTSTDSSGRRSSWVARPARACSSGPVSGGCRRLRGHRRRARTTLTSAAYRVSSLPRYSQDSSPRTTAKKPYSALACRRLWPTR
jgi:hypothetical protein